MNVIDPARREQVLAEVNSIRREWLLDPLPELPKGVRKDATDCVIARALSYGTDGRHMMRVDGTYIEAYWIEPDGTQTPLWTSPTSWDAALFIEEFDRGDHSDLIDYDPGWRHDEMQEEALPF